MAMTSATAATAITSATTSSQQIKSQMQPTFNKPLRPPRSRIGQQARAEKTARHQTQPARPYIQLLMPEPPPDQNCDPNERKEQCDLYFRVLSRGYLNKDWKTRPVFDEVNDEDNEPLSPINSEGESDASSSSDEVRDNGVVMIDGEGVVDMVG